MQIVGGGEGVAQRAVEPDTLAWLQLAEAIRARADALDQEVEANPVRGRASFGDREGARQEGALAGLLPVLLGGQHVELTRQGLGTLGVDQGEEAVAAGRLVRGNDAQTSAKGCSCRARTRERMPVHC